mgnify:CR=1 FL=1
MGISQDYVESTVQDLGARWKVAREYAFREVLKSRVREDEFLLDINSLEEEKFDELLKSVFLNSRNLGRSYQKSKNLSWEKSDFATYAARLGSPCFHGT